jgi:hypothetical protein
MVADLDRENATLVKDVDALQQIVCALFDVVECPEHFAASRKNSGCIAFSRERFLPRLQQRI